MQVVSHFASRVLLGLTLLADSGMLCSAQATVPVPTLQGQIAEVVAGVLPQGTNYDLAHNLQVPRPPFLLPTNAHLRVVSIKTTGRGLWFLRMECGSRQACLPFYALLRSSEADADVIRGFGAAPHSQLPPDAAKRNTQLARPPIERSGDRVEVVEELSGMHLRTRAVCLQPGSLGDRIRVRNLSTHRVVMVTVAGAELVKVGQ